MRRSIVAIFAGILIASSALAVAPHPDIIEQWKADGSFDKKIRQWQEFKARGGCAPSEHVVWKPRDRHESMAAQAGPDTVRVCVIMVDFSDNPMSDGVNGTPAAFDSILFSDGSIDTAGAIINPTGSMTDYYMETSYGQFFVQGDVYGPYRAPQPYSYYVGGDNGFSKSPELVHWLVNTFNSQIDFSLYAQDGANCDGLVIIHAGRGAEELPDGSVAIWSHKYTIGNLFLDGVILSNYTMNPEETGQSGPLTLSPIGVFCHEYGHFLGLPDLYDVNYSIGSSGTGYWSLMSSGNYLGASKRPAHLDAWCKGAVGFVDIVDVTQNMFQAPIPAIEYNPVVYRLRNGITGTGEYWLVENRQKIGFDGYLPGAGLCIWHYDLGANSSGGSNVAPPYRLAIEQADGQFQLEYFSSSGDGGDPFPGATNKRDFHDFSIPASTMNTPSEPEWGNPSRVGVWNISNSDSIMYADLDIEYSRPWIVPGAGGGIVFNDDAPRGDGDGIPEAGETIHLYCTVQNYMRFSYNARVSVASQSPSVTFITPTVNFNQDLILASITNAEPIVFQVANSLTSMIDSFFVTITSDSVAGKAAGEFTKTFAIEKQVGATQVLVVDDDRGDNYQQDVVNAFTAMRIPAAVWTKQTQGSPTPADLSPYSRVFWNTGKHTASMVFTAGDVTAMKSFLDGGGSMMLSTASGIDDLLTLDSSFVANYFRAGRGATGFWPDIAGISGSAVGGGTLYRLANELGFTQMQLLTPLSGAEASFEVNVLNPAYGSSGLTGLAYNGGSFRTVLLSFPVDVLNDDVGGHQPKDTLIARVLSFFGGQATDVYDGSPFEVLPQSFTLVQNYPNPFNPTTTIQYTLRSAEGVGAKAPRTRLVVFNALGQEVATLVDKVQIPGTYQVEWDGSDDRGGKVASGIYFYRLERGDERQAMKMLLVK